MAASGANSYAIDPGWRALWSDLGVSWPDALALAGLPGDLLSRRSQTLSSSEYFALFRALETLAKDPLLPVRIVEKYAVESFQPPLFAALCSDSFATAVERVATYKRLIGPMKLEVKTDDRSLALELRWVDGVEPPPAGLVLCELAFLLRLARIGTREPITATRVTLADDRAPLTQGLDAFFGAPVERGAAHTLVIAKRDAERPFLTVNDGLWALFEPELRRRLSDLDARATTSERVRAALLELIPSGRASLADAAKKLSSSTRTLQRRLGDEGTSFQELLDQTRKELALHYLRRTAISAGEISFLLGFSEPSSFFRAFQGWTGETPERVRHAERSA
ncbi:MAG: AraC family transcriptional regulator ligand-binding domain-containing protein [Myxococcales bacterium]|nr:AraC family transcriptional regulator ligand-binding domain-containing protein [Myxococcales bacterium]